MHSAIPLHGTRSPPGFTLIELMIVVAIIGIIAAIALPSYQESVRKSRRADAKLLIIHTAQRLERCFADCNSYTTKTACTANTTCPVTAATVTPLPIRSPDGNYEIAAGNGHSITATAFTLVATPVAGKPQTKDTKCTSFSQTSAGRRTATGTLGDDCWK